MRRTFAEKARAYLEAIKPYRKPGTLARIARNLHTMEQDLQAIQAADLDHATAATAPARITEQHIGRLLLMWQNRPRPGGLVGLNASTQKKYLQDLNGFLVWCGFPVIAKMRQNPAVKTGLPREPDPEPESLDEQDLTDLRAACEGWEGWRGAVGLFLVSFLPETGLRPMEVRGAWLADVNLRRARMLVRDPKVKTQKRRYVPLSAAARAALADFLPVREAYLRDECRVGESEWLLPFGQEVGPTREDGTLAVVVGPWGDAVLRKLAADLRRRSGVAFSWKTMRSSFGQRLVNRGVPLEDASVAMRHKKIETTRKYYVVLDQERALNAAIRALDGPVVREE